MHSFCDKNYVYSQCKLFTIIFDENWASNIIFKFNSIKYEKNKEK